MGMTVPEILDSHRTGRPVVMGILNVTPDSFSDGGAYLAPADALKRARQLVTEGADVLDVGAESTRPGSQRVSPGEQLDRLRPILPIFAEVGVPVSIDTTSSEVAAAALDAGAVILNDVSAGRDDPDLFALAAERSTPLVLMHMLGEPKSMQADPHYEDVVAEVAGFLADRLAAAEAAGVAREKVILDPGIGFGKTLEHNLALLAGIDSIAALGRPVLVGPSRKRFIGELSGERDAARRVPGTIAASLAAWRGGATLLRVHDVEAIRQALAVAVAIEEAGGQQSITISW